MKRVALLGMLAMALVTTACGKPKRNPALEDEIARREAFGRHVVEEADAGRMLNVASRSDVLFEEDFSPIMYDPPDDYRAHAFRWMGKNGHVRLRTQGGRPMKVKAMGWINEKVIRAKPVITAYIDGQLIATTGSIEHDHWVIEAVLPPELVQREWVDLTLACNAVAFHWGEPPTLKVVVLYGFEWHPAP